MLAYFKLVHAKLCLFVFGATFAALHWQFISMYSCFIRDYCLWVVKSLWPSGQGFEVAGSSPIPSKAFLFRGLFLFFLFSIYKAAFFVVFLLVFRKRSLGSV